MTSFKPRTTFATNESPFTGKPPLREVPIPKIGRVAKGETKYDAEFDKLAQMQSALEFPEKNYQSVRRALQRYIVNKNLKGKVAVRQQIKRDTRDVVVWLEAKNEMPRVRSVDAGVRNKERA